MPPRPSPPSSQSITGSAYSGSDAVKMTTVYHDDTCSRCHVDVSVRDRSAQLSDE